MTSWTTFYIENCETEEGVWRFKEIIDHQGPLIPSSDNYKGSRWNVLIHWETGEKTWEPLDLIRKTDPVTCAIYAKDKNLLEQDGWKSLRKIAKKQRTLLRLAKQAKLQSFRHKPIYMFGYLVPRNHRQAMDLDKANGNTKWAESERIELGQLDSYSSFDDKGVGYKPGPGYKKITVHMVYAVKHDGRHKARLVAGGHLTDTPIDSVYSSVVSLRGVRFVVFLAELNGLKTWATDIGNAYLEAFTEEKVYFIAGGEFGDREGHTLIIVKALYGLKSSGLRWHQRFSKVLRDMGFIPSRAERDIWMRDCGDHYECIATYVDDLIIGSKDPEAIVNTLTSPKYGFKLKGTGDVSYHFGCIRLFP